MERSDPRDVAAFLAAVDENGTVDPVLFEAQRLILHNRHGGGIDNDALMRAVHASPLYATGERDHLIRAINDSLDTPEAQRGFQKAMGGSYAWSVAKHGASEALSWAETKAQAADHSISGALAASQRDARATLNDPNASWAQRLEARATSEVVGLAQRDYGQAKGAASDAAGMVFGVVDAAKLGYRLSTDPAFRDGVLQVVRNYAAETANDPSRPVSDAWRAAKGAYDTWNAGYEKAKAEGRGEEYVGKAQGAAAVEILSAVIPATKAGKVGEALELLDHAPIRSMDEAASVLEKTAALEREGGAAAKSAEAVNRSAIASARHEGKLAEFIEAAKKTDTVNGLLRSGVFSPDDLKEIAKIDAKVFKEAEPVAHAGAVAGKVKDGVTFEEAINASTKGIDLTKLTSKQVGDIGEAWHTYEMAKDGYTDIIAIKNKSGHGIDFVGRNPKTNKLEFHEVKTSRVGDAATQKGDPDEFVRDRLRLAANARGIWAERNMYPGLKEIAEKIRDEIGRGEIEAKWVRIHIERTPEGTLKIQRAESKLEPWLKEGAAPKHAALEVPATIADAKPFTMPKDMRIPDHPAHDMYRTALSEVRVMEAAQGIPAGPHSEKLAAGLTVAAEYANAGIDRVELHGRQAVAHSGGSSVALATDFALSRSVEQHSEEWRMARSLHYADAPAAERSPEQARLLGALSPRDQAMYAKIRESLPAQFGDDMVAHASLAARRAGIETPEQMRAVTIRGDHLFIVGTQTGISQSVNLSQPAPPLRETVYEAYALDRQQTQQQAAQQQMIASNTNAPAMRAM